MSAIISGRVYWTEFKELCYTNKSKKKICIKETTAKIVMLAIADSADDFGENSWNSFETLATKTSIQRRSVIRVARALINNDYLKIAGISRYGTNNFSINLSLLGQPPVKRTKNGRPKTGDSDAFTSDSDAETGDPESKTGDLQSLDPSLSSPDPSSNPKAAPKAATPPEIKLFREATKRYPPKENFDDVVASIQKVKARLGREVTKDDLLQFFKQWTWKGYNKTNLSWLDWAVSGIVPNGKPAVNQTEPRAADAIRQFMANHGGVNG